MAIDLAFLGGMFYILRAPFGGHKMSQGLARKLAALGFLVYG